MGQSHRHKAPSGSHELPLAHQGRPGACSQADVERRTLRAAFCCFPGTVKGRNRNVFYPSQTNGQNAGEEFTGMA